MPTQAERQKLYRERLKQQNPEKYEAFRKNNAERTNKNRKRINDCQSVKEQDEMRRKWRENKKKAKETKLVEVESKKLQKLNNKINYRTKKENLELKHKATLMTKEIKKKVKPFMALFESIMAGSSPPDTMVKLEGEEGEEVMEVEDVKQEPEDPLPEDVLCDFSVPVPVISPESIKKEPEMPVISPLAKQTYRCQFCDNALIVNEVNIGPKGLATLQRVSERRQDNRFPPDFTGPVQGHARCRSNYTNIKCIDAVEKRLKKMDVTPETVLRDDTEETTRPTLQGSPVRADMSLSKSSSDIVDLDSDAESCSETSMSTPVFNIEVFNMKRKEAMLNNSLPAKMKRESNSADKRFDYLEQCLFCGGNASDVAMSKSSKKTSVVTRTDTGEKMYRASLDYGPEYDEIRERIKGKDLVALRARYHQSCYKSFVQPPRAVPRGRRPDQAILTKMDPVFKHIEENLEDSQFPIDELHKIAGDVTRATMLYKIVNNFGGVRNKDDIVINPPVTKILEENWHEKKLKDEKSERLRIVRTAANIILEDIRAIHFDTKAYPPSSTFLDEIDSVIPETLRTLVETLVTKYKKDPESLDSTVTALSHSIMSAVRPRTFKSPILLGIGSLIHLKFASKTLIDLLSSIGFCASYKDVSELEMSAAFQNLPHFKPEFTQFVYDSMEVANKEIMVGVKCDTPSPKDKPIVVTDWKPGHPPLGLDAEFRVHLDKYVGHTSTLANIAIKDHRDNSAILPTRGDALWLFGNNEPSFNLPNWNDFLNKMPRVKESPKSKILPLPLIEAPPSKDAIYTAIKEAQKYSQETCLVTFSQPLYQIAQEIVNSEDMTIEMCNVVLRLGGFDLLKAFLGVIGYIMSGSRLKELWCNIYSAEQVEKMMTGHAYYRALRAHFLTRSELFNIITKDFDLTPEERLEIEGILEGYRHVACSLQNGDNQRNQEPLAITLELLEQRGSTAQLWVQYFRMTTLVAQFIEAEKTGNWDLHLSTLKKMLPYFHAAGYFDYAKSCTLYLQDMEALGSKMDAVAYNNFTTKGYFSVKWTEHLGDFSDQVVDKTMTMLKRPGGVMNGTKTTDAVLPYWVSASPTLSKIATLVEDFCKPVNSVEPKIKDDQDAAVLKTWFEENNPFPETVNLVSPSTGLIEKTSNCHEAEMVGKQIMGKVVGENFRDVHYERSECVRPLSKAIIEIDDLNVPIEQDTILKRIPTKKNQEKVKSFFNYELAPYPISMFNEQGMLEADDSQIFSLFSPIELPDGTNHLHVIDGEFLLHQIPWTEGATISAIAYSYAEYVKKNFKNAIVVFGGNKETKILKRSKTKGPIVEFQKDTAITVTKESFLSNDRNKDRLVQYLILDFTRSGIKIKLSSDNLHSHIVQIALDNSGTYDDVCVVSNDANVLMSMFRISDKSNFYFMHQGRRKMYTYVVNKNSNDKVENSVLFIQALTGCDTTSAIFQKDKERVSLDLSAILRNDYRKLITVFTDPTSDKNEIAEEGEKFIRCLYSDDASLLHVIRYKGVVNSVTRSRYDLACLPPSKGAVKQHLYRTYHQIQKWLGNYLPPTEWGWRMVEDRLEPIMTLDEIAPKELLDMISCKCVGLCNNKCTCRRAGLNCCVLCINCNGKSCHGLDMEKGASVVGNNIISRCDTFGNPFDPYPCTHYEDVTLINDEDEVPEPVMSRPKRVKRDVNNDEVRRQDVEELYIVEVQDE